MKPASAPVEVLYIIGHGRSGSTMLDIVLGNHPEVKSGGELANLPLKGWVNEGLLCSCGETANLCPFWSEVRREWAGRAGSEGVVEDYIRLQDTYEQYRWIGRLLVADRLRPTARLKEYLRLSVALFEAIRSVSGRPVIVDSSKNQMRVLAFQMAPEIDLRVLHLVRDVRGVAAARRKAFQKDAKAGILKDIRPRPVWRSSARWAGTNLLAGWAKDRVSPEKAAYARYEDFVADPERVLGRIGRAIDRDLAELGRHVAGGGELSVGHIFGGNRLRMAETLTLRDDTSSWRGTLSPAEQALSWRVAGPLMTRYGYKK